MKRKEWHKKYRQTLIDDGVDKKFAQECLQAGMGEYDYAANPEECAESEMSYWEE